MHWRKAQHPGRWWSVCYHPCDERGNISCGCKDGNLQDKIVEVPGLHWLACMRSTVAAAIAGGHEVELEADEALEQMGDRALAEELVRGVRL